MKWNMRLFVVLLVLAASAGRAQEFKGGLCLGLSASQIDGDSQSGYHKAGIFGGMYVQRVLTDIVSAQLEMQYIQKGAYNKNTESKLSAHYIDVPMLVQYRKWDFIFEAGLVPGVLIGAKVVSDFNIEYDIDTYRRFSLNIAGGARYLVAKKLGVSARIAYSALPIASISNAYKTRNQYHNVLNFGIYVPLK